MTQMTVDQAYARKLAGSMLTDLGLTGAQEYALDMMGSVCSETLRRRWSDVLQQLNEISHPLRFSSDALRLVFSGEKTAVTCASMRVPVGGSFWLSDLGRERRFTVSAVHEGAISDIVRRFWMKEGYHGPLPFIMDLARAYPEIGPDSVVYTHEFEEVPA